MGTPDRTAATIARALYSGAEEPRDASGDLSGVGRGGGSAGRRGRAARARRGRGPDRGRGDRRELCRFPDGGGALSDTAAVSIQSGPGDGRRRGAMRTPRDAL